MIIRFEFQLPEEAEDYKMYSNAHEYYTALCDLYDALFPLWDEAEWKTDEARQLAERLRTIWVDCVSELEIP